MNYYEVAIIGYNFDNLTYSSTQEIPLYSKVLVSIRGRKKLAVCLRKLSEEPKFNTIEIDEIYNEQLSSQQFKLLEFMSKYYAAYSGICLENFILNPNKNLSYNTSLLNTSSLVLSEKQEECFNYVLNNDKTLIFGDTGAGKTEIYIKLIEKYLALKKQVLFLMPEISLTPQMCGRLSKYFGNDLIVWHSKISKKNKENSLNDFSSKNKLLVIGARSAMFLPFDNLGLIIVDEEHDNSYKSSKYPCYNARDLAIFLANIHNAKLVLGSATPSLQTYTNKNIKIFRLRGTYFKTEKEFIYDNSNNFLSDMLLNELHINYMQKKQSLIFIPTRGNFRQVVCKECGKVKICKSCSIAMSLHKNIYKCHYCGRKEYFKPQCEYCFSVMLESKIMGTMELSKKLKEHFPLMNIEILDSDNVSSLKSLDNVLSKLSSGKIDILVGTQLISKGHDYANVTFCAILGLDEYLNYPDYKARENTLSLAMQISGRVGRREKGKVLINTNNKDFFSAYINDYEDYLKDEMEFRNNYPPYKRLLRFIISSKDEAESKRLCDDLVNHLIEIRINENDYEIVGYGKCAIDKINNFYRYYVLLRSDHKMLLSNIANNYKKLNKVTIDIDPILFT